MSPAAAVAPHYRPDGDLYDQVPRLLFTLDPTYQRSAVLVASIVLNADKRGELEGDAAELLTNREIRRRIEAETGRRYSLSFVKKGLYAIHRVLGKVVDAATGKGLNIIDRIRQHGRRVILLVRGIREAGKAKMTKPGDPIVPAAAPLCTPPPEKRNPEETTTTSAGSSSSLQVPPEGTQDADPEAVRRLYERARQLLDEVTYDRVRSAVQVYTADWVRKVLDLVERRNRKPGNVRKPWGYAIGWLKNWKAEGGPPDDPAPAPPPPLPSRPTIRDTAAEDIRQARLQGRWDALGEPGREEIRAAVRAEKPGVERFKAAFDAFCLDELERRQAADPPQRE